MNSSTTKNQFEIRKKAITILFVMGILKIKLILGWTKDTKKGLVHITHNNQLLIKNQ